MNRFAVFLPLFVLFLSACDQEKVKKEAYDRGFADGKAAAAREMAAQTTSRLQGTALDRPRTNGTGSKAYGTGPTSHLQGTALDQRPQKH